MTEQLLADPENAKAYQTLCDCPSGSTRSWAAKAGWTKSRMERFLLQLRAAGLAQIDVGIKGSTFVPSKGVPDASQTRLGLYLGSKSESDKVPRYGDSPRQPETAPAAIADDDAVRLIRTANAVLLERKWEPLEGNEDNHGSLAGARKILKVVPIDLAVPLMEQAVRLFNPSSTGGKTLQSLGHPFITRYVVNEYRRTQRDLERGQLSMVFVERVEHRPVYGARKHEEAPVRSPGVVSAVMLDIAAQLGVRK